MYSNRNRRYKKSESDSEYEESKTESEKKNIHDYMTKLFSGISELKDEFKNDKLDTILDYIKAIDSETKNAIEVLCRVDKLSQVDDFQKQRIILETIPQKLDYIKAEMEVLYGKMDYMSTSMSDLYKLMLENQHVKLEVLNCHKKLTYMESLIEHLYYKSVGTPPAVPVAETEEDNQVFRTTDAVRSVKKHIK